MGSIRWKFMHFCGAAHGGLLSGLSAKKEGKGEAGRGRFGRDENKPALPGAQHTHSWPMREPLPPSPAGVRARDGKAYRAGCGG